MSSSRFLTACAAGAALVALTAGVAFASAPLPKPGKAYATSSNKSGVGITLVTATDPKTIEPGAAALGSQFALSGGSVLCRKAKKSAGFHGTPFAIFGFPGAKLKLTHGKYGFAKAIKVPGTVPLGSDSVKAFTLKLKVTGTVVNANLISGTVKAKGGPCTSKKPLKYKAKLNNKIPVAPGQ